MSKTSKFFGVISAVAMSYVQNSMSGCKLCLDLIGDTDIHDAHPTLSLWQPNQLDYRAVPISPFAIIPIPQVVETTDTKYAAYYDIDYERLITVAETWRRVWGTKHFFAHQDFRMTDFSEKKFPFSRPKFL